MGRKGKRTKGIEEAHPFAGMSRVNPNAAGADIGAVEIMVCVSGENNTQIVKALTGTWREEHLFVLKQSLELYDFYTEQIEACDGEIDRVYALIRPDWETGELPPIPKKKQNTHSKNAPESAREIRQHLKRINGVDLSLVDGFGVSLAQTVTMEVGSDVGDKSPTEKNFCSWLGVAPKHEISGGKVLKNKTLLKNQLRLSWCPGLA